MNKRIVQTTLTKAAKLKYEHSVGTLVTLIDRYIDKVSGKKTWFIPPKVDGLYLEKAKELINEANKKRGIVLASRGSVNPKDPVQGDAFVDKENLLDFFSLATESVILLYSAVEFLANYSIEKATNLYYNKRKYSPIFKLGVIRFEFKKIVTLSQRDILFLRTEEKLKSVLPQHYSCKSPSQKDFWESFMVLKRFRDDVIHATRNKTYGANQAQNSVFAELLAIDLNKLLTDTEQLLGYIDQNFK